MHLDRCFALCAPLALWTSVAVFGCGALGGCASQASGDQDVEIATTTNGELPIAKDGEDEGVQTPAPKSDVPALAKSPKVWDVVQLEVRARLGDAPQATR